MNNAQKVIKYVAIAVAVCLTVSIITGILTAVGAIFGVSALIDVANGTMETMDYTKEYTNISNLEIDVSAINLEILPSADTSSNVLKVIGTEIPTDYKFEQENNKLEIKGKKVSSNAKLVIYLPTTVGDLDIDVGAGDIQIKDISVQELALNTGATETNIQNLTVMSSAEIDAGTGEIVIDNSNITNLDIDAGVGNLEYTGYLQGTSDIDCGVGNVELNLKGTETMYKITAEKGIGELKINGNKLSGTQTVGSGTNIVELSGGIGSLAITY